MRASTMTDAAAVAAAAVLLIRVLLVARWATPRRLELVLALVLTGGMAVLGGWLVYLVAPEMALGAGRWLQSHRRSLIAPLAAVGLLVLIGGVLHAATSTRTPQRVKREELLNGLCGMVAVNGALALLAMMLRIESAPLKMFFLWGVIAPVLAALYFLFLYRSPEQQVVRAAPPAPGPPPQCPICREALLRRMVFCRRCLTPHHRDCWRYYGRCSIYGCGEVGFSSHPSRRREEIVFIEKPQ